ncbi:tyrosine-type recombinase/integrase [Streptomyces sp. NPDC006482]|uniref:tyrosine-type recombinase/integrase n=1 Tax=Streptomyces sp. NPDC006482 TaxID=3154306 RepID=UPI00339E7DB9
MPGPGRVWVVLSAARGQPGQDLEEGQAGPSGRHHRGSSPARRAAHPGRRPRSRRARVHRTRSSRISAAVLRDTTHRDAAVMKLGHEHLRRHDLRHTGLTWFADAGVQVHVLRTIAGHGSLTITTTQRYLHPDVHKITAVGAALSAHHGHCRARSRSPAERSRRVGPQVVPKNESEAVSDCSETASDLRLFRVGTTGFEPATP